MHYYWLKKKWFYDIIISNLLFAFVLTVNSKSIEIETDIDFAHVAPFEAELDYEYDLSWNINDFDEMTIYPFALNVLDIDHHELNFSYVKFEEMDSIPFVPNAIQYSAYHKFTDKTEILRSMPFGFGFIEFIKEFTVSSEVCHSEVYDAKVYIPKYAFVNDASVDESMEASFGLFIPKYELSGNLDTFSFDSFSLALYVPYYRVNATVSKKDYSLFQRFLLKANTNIDIITSFYVYPVLRLKMSDIQVKKLNISADVILATYLTRFYNMEGWIVEDDLTGKKFRDLR